MAAQPPFQYRPLVGDEIRLVTITSTGGGISCAITHHALANAPSFYALSYAWGTEPASARIDLGGDALAVTPHLFNGLLALDRLVGRSISFWIDAICIDQSNDAEKAVQVPRMTDIYSTAARVAVWLGPAADESDLFLSKLTDLNTAFAAAPEIARVHKGTLKGYGLPTIEDKVWPAAFKLAYRAWFQRLWVVQEVVLAKSVAVCCGERQVDFDDVTAFYNYLRSAFIMDDIIRQHLIELPDTDSGLHGLPIISIWRQRIQAGGLIPVLSILSIMRYKVATEAVDKIYGTMGLMSSDFRDKIVIDYSADAKEHFWRLYVEVCRLLLGHEDGFGILNLTVSDERDPNLPSWCPDFRHQPAANSLGVAFDAGVAKSAEDLAAIPTAASADTVSFPSIIKPRGLQMDRVKEVIGLFHKGVANIVADYSPSRAQEVLECEARCLQVSQDVYDSQGQVPVQHIETLLTAMHPNRARYSTEQAVQDYARWKEWYRVMASGSADERPSMDQNLEMSAQRYNSGASIAWKGHCFFSTEGGRIGIGPKAMAKGDSIHVFFGAFVPHILRYDLVTQTYVFIGPAFVHGLMDGEAFRAKDPVNTYAGFLIR